MLNLPNGLNEKLKDANTILIVGAGGGQDVLCGLPLYYTFLKQGKKVHLANLTHTDFKTLNEYTDPLVLDSNVLGANSVIKVPSQNYVEGYLSQYFKAALNEDKIVWMINRNSVQELKKSFERLITHLNIDAIVLVDGGVDSIMQGDEGKNVLTNLFIDTTLCLAAIQQIELPIRDNFILASCNDNSIDLNSINKNMSNIALQNGFYGGCYLLNYNNSYKFMKSAYSYVKNNNNICHRLERFVKLTDSIFEEGEVKEGLLQFLFFNPEALAYNNIVIHKILEANSFYDTIQLIAPFVGANKL